MSVMYTDGKTPYSLTYGFMSETENYREMAALTTPPQSHFMAQRTAVNHARRVLQYDTAAQFTFHHSLGTSNFRVYAPGGGVLCWEEIPLNWTPQIEWEDEE